MKADTIAKRTLLVLSLALLPGVFGLIPDNDSISRAKGSWTNVAFAQEIASSPANEVASPDQAKSEKEFFPGSRLKAEDAVRKASLIIVGKFLDPGICDFSSTRVTHGKAKVEVLQVLKGYISEALSLNFEVLDYSPDVEEKAPEVGQRYIIFIKEKTGMTIKFLPDTEEQRWHITDLVSSTANKDR